MRKNRRLPHMPEWHKDKVSRITSGIYRSSYENWRAQSKRVTYLKWTITYGRSDLIKTFSGWSYRESIGSRK